MAERDDVEAAAQALARLREIAVALRHHAQPRASGMVGTPADYGPLIDDVRNEVAARRTGYAETSSAPLEMPRVQVRVASMPADAAAPIDFRASYGLGELLAYDGEAFVRNAYRALFHRDADPGGLLHHLDVLYEGRLSKVEMLEKLADTDEGRRNGVRIAGLSRAARIRRWRNVPVIGALIVIAQHIASLPIVVRTLERHDLMLYRRERDLRVATATLNDLALQATAAIDSLGTLVNRLQHEKAPRAATLALTGRVAMLQREVSSLAGGADWRTAQALLVRFVDEAIEEMARSAAGLRRLGEQKADAAQVRVHAEDTAAQFRSVADELQDVASAIRNLQAEKAEAATVRERMDKLAASLQQLNDIEKAKADELTMLSRRLSSREHLEAVLGQADPRLDDFYVAFEDRFRGTRESIRSRVTVYTPTVREVDAGTPAAPVIDIGCGRGEWLEELRDGGFVARGIDNNPTMVRTCRDLGLDVAQADALEYLEGLVEGSVGAITAMHVIEHLPFARRLRLLDLSLRALRPGGVAIFETPNPENLNVGACTFWNDPTHLQPLPPEPLRATAELRGFGRVEVLRLHPYPHDAHLGRVTGSGGPVRDALNHALYGPQDYAILCYKD